MYFFLIQANNNTDFIIFNGNENGYSLCESQSNELEPDKTVKSDHVPINVQNMNKVGHYFVLYFIFDISKFMTYIEYFDLWLIYFFKSNSDIHTSSSSSSSSKLTKLWFNQVGTS